MMSLQDSKNPERETIARCDNLAISLGRLVEIIAREQLLIDAKKKYQKYGIGAYIITFNSPEHAREVHDAIIKHRVPEFKATYVHGTDILNYDSFTTGKVSTYDIENECVVIVEVKWGFNNESSNKMMIFRTGA